MGKKTKNLLFSYFLRCELTFAKQGKQEKGIHKEAQKQT